MEKVEHLTRVLHKLNRDLSDITHGMTVEIIDDALGGYASADIRATNLRAQMVNYPLAGRNALSECIAMLDMYGAVYAQEKAERLRHELLSYKESSDGPNQLQNIILREKELIGFCLALHLKGLEASRSIMQLAPSSESAADMLAVLDWRIIAISQVASRFEMNLAHYS